MTTQLHGLAIAAAAGLAVNFCLNRIIETETARKFIIGHQGALHPIKISYYGAAFGWLSMLLYVFSASAGYWLFIASVSSFMISWICDGVDGKIARACGLATERGKKLDPLMDKLKYLPMLAVICVFGGMAWYIFLPLAAIDIGGQLLRGTTLMRRHASASATIAGKIKTNLINLYILSYYFLAAGHADTVSAPYGRPLYLFSFVLVVMAAWSVISKFSFAERTAE